MKNVSLQNGCLLYSVCRWIRDTDGAPRGMLEHGKEWWIRMRCGVQGDVGRQEDLASTYVLCLCPRIKVSLIYTSRGDRGGLCFHKGK